MTGAASERMHLATRIDPVSIGVRVTLAHGEQGYPAGAGITFSSSRPAMLDSRTRSPSWP